MRKTFASSLDEDVQNTFKAKCAESGLPVNVVLETFMKAYNAGELEMKMIKKKLSIEQSND